MADETEAPAAKKSRRLTEAEWAEAKALYETGRLTKTALAEKYAISRQSMHEGLTARGAVYGSKSKAVEDAVVTAQVDQSVKRLEDIAAMKDRQRQRVELIQSLAVKQITDQIREKSPIANRKADMAVLKDAMGIIAKGRDELYHIYDLHRDPAGADEIPEFIVGEYSNEEIEALNRQRLGIVDDDLEAIAASVVESGDEDPLGDLLDGAP